MTCDFCGEREATVHLTEMIDAQTRELHLCEACAREKGAAATQGFGLAELLAGLSDFALKSEGEKKEKLVCPACGMTYEDFRKSGRLGCGNCYETFHRLLAPLLRRIHGSTHHVGRSPELAAKSQAATAAATDDLKALKEKLKSAVAGEAFEEAARLRDKIRVLESKPPQKEKRKK